LGVRIINWNIEWMNNWFVGGGDVALRMVHDRSGITSVDDLCRRVGRVILDLDPDVLTLEEGPSDIREMQLFVSYYLDDSFDVFGGFDGGAQKIYALVKKDGGFINPRIATDGLTQELQEPWQADIDGDHRLENYDFTRIPLVLEGETGGNGENIRILTLHTKSKYVHNGQALFENEATRGEFVIAALKNRRRISSEAMRTRKYLDDIVRSAPEARVIVTGDFNDGPGIDYFESRYLTHNVTDILLGSTYYPNWLFHHALIPKVSENQRYTAIFDDYIDNIQNRKLLLDHFLVSPALAPRVTNAAIAHDAYDASTDDQAEGRQKYVSDHRPILIELEP
jgi:hypothetical protein